jgi:methyl-accepting chemotaxis protein
VQFLRDTRIRTKLLVIALVPVLGLSYLAVLRAVDRWSEATSAGAVRRLIEVGVAIGGALHDTQRERGATSLFVSSAGVKFGGELRAQRQQTDRSLLTLRATVAADLSVLSSRVRDQLEAVFSTLASLPERRQRADRLAAPTKEFITFYTDLNSRLLAAVSAVATASTDAELGRGALGYVAFLNAKEKTGIERAQLANAFAADRFGPGQLVTVASLLAAQASFMEVFRSVGEPGAVADYHQVESGPTFAQVDALERTALERAASGGFAVAPEIWFATMTRKIDELKTVEDRQAGNLDQRATEIERHARMAFVWALVLCVCLVGVTAAFTAVAVRDITRPLDEVIRAARQMAAGDARNDVDYQSPNELGILADSFREAAAYLRAVTEVVNAVARGDLATSVRPRSEGDLLGAAVAALVTRLRELVGAMHSAGHEIGASSQALSKVSGQLNASAGATLDATNSLSAAGTEMHATIADIARSSADAATAAKEMAAETGTTTEKVARLDSSSRQIGDVLVLITKIADQTKLLALNATIEAARAGEAGKGFAVVATEVKDLARNTGGAVNEIHGRIASMQTDASAAVQAIETIAVKTGRVSEVTSTIAHAVEAQTATTAEIGGRMTSLVSSAEATQEAANNIATASEEMLRLAGRFSALASGFRLGQRSSESAGPLLSAA